MNITQQKLDYLRLCRTQNLGLAALNQLLKKFKCPSIAVAEIAKTGLNLRGREIRLCSEKLITKEISNCHKFGAQIITLLDSSYPVFLKEIANPPAIITAKGNLDLLNSTAFAIVGARNASYNGINFAKAIANSLVENGLITVSGLARGIDKAVHQASLKNTIAVIAGGINNIYPSDNSRLYQELFEQSLVITEQPFASVPFPNNFIARNRIISGLSIGALVVEAGLRSGSLTTANFANDQGRQVFAVPGAPYDHRALGCNKLIKQGAKMVADIDDILEELNLPEIKVDDSDSNSATNITNNYKAIPSDALQELVLSFLDYSGVDIDYIIAQSGRKAQEIRSALTEMELLGKIIIKNGQALIKTNTNYQK